MTRRSIRLGQAIVVAAAVTFLLGVVIAGGSDGSAPVAAGFDLAATRPGGPAGMVHLHRTRTRLTGTVAVWGLEPGGRHHAALRGPQAGCDGAPAQVAARLAPLVAGADGVAVTRIDVPALSQSFDEGLALTVHASEAKASPVVACGTTARVEP